MACTDLYGEVCSFRNLELAYRKARKGKRNKKAVQDFEFNLEENLLQLKRELETFTYEPRPLKQFAIRDPKTRVISASHFRDRVVHHALCNVIQPILERRFIHDSYANRIGRGTTKALERFHCFKRRMTQNGRLVNKPKDNNMVVGYVLKADIKHYFESVDHEILMAIIQKSIRDDSVLWLIRKILNNHEGRIPNKGMPLGNLTSQLFANLYLNGLDYFVKHRLQAKFYIRYVDDFVIMHNCKETLLRWKEQIANFLKTLKLEPHPDKTTIYPLHNGTSFLGYRIFYHHILLKKSNIRVAENRMRKHKILFRGGDMTYEKAIQSIESWMSYAKYANSYGLRKMVAKSFNQAFL